jgi:hypothetical protein
VLSSATPPISTGILAGDIAGRRGVVVAEDVAAAVVLAGAVLGDARLIAGETVDRETGAGGAHREPQHQRQQDRQT